MKKIHLLFCFALLSFSLSAQMYVNGDTLYGNEWIDYDQTYYKIAVTQDGFYKLTHAELSNVGVFSGGNNPQGAQFQMFYLGKEIPIHVSQSGNFGNGDFIAFFGQRNRGQLDNHIYLKPEYNPNPEYSLFTDTSYYFLTWNSDGNHLRYNQSDNDLTNPPTPESYCWHEVVQYYFNQHDAGKRYTGVSNSWSSAFDLGEGWAKNFANSQTISIATPHLYASGPNSQLRVRYRAKVGNHHLNLSVNGVLQVDTTFSTTAVNEHYIDLASSTLPATSNIELLGLLGAADDYGVSVLRFNYPRQFNFGGELMFRFRLLASNSEQYLEISNFNVSGGAPVLYDITNQLFVETAIDGNLIKVVLPSSSSARELVLVNVENFANILSIEQRDFVDFNNASANYLIISHSSLMNDGQGNNFVQDYADYRSSIQGGGFDALVADISQLFDQFAYGINRHEISIRNFTHYAIKNWGADYLFLIGKGVNYGSMRPANSSWHEFYRLPAFGQPQSDNLFAATNESNVPLIPVGRLAAQTPHHVDLYLRKIKAFESNESLPQTLDDKAWMKRVIHLGGGDPNIQDFIKSELGQVQSIIENGTFGADVHPFYKTSNDVIQEAPSEQVAHLINTGVSMVTFFGHSSPSLLDFDLESPESFNNYGKYTH